MCQQITVSKSQPCYTIVTGGSASTFVIDQSTAEIRLASALDYETTTSYVLTIVATDGGASVVRAFFTIKLSKTCFVVARM